MRTLPSILALLSVGASLFLAGCDNPACVFAGNCGGDSGGGGLGQLSARRPFDGAWVDELRPEIEDVFPTGTAADPATPVVVVFSESMLPGTPEAGLQLVQQGSPIPIAMSQPALIGDGRVLVLRPTQPLPVGKTFEIRFTDHDAVDLNGQAVARTGDGIAGTFAVAATPPVAPAVLMTFPANGGDFESDTTEVVVVFSRPVDEDTIDDQSFDLTVAGAAPAFDPDPTPLLVDDFFPTSDFRVFRWRSVDGASEPVSLGRGVRVELLLSPSGARIEDAAGVAVPEKTVEFDIAPFRVAMSALLSSPDDAINIANLTGSSNALDLRVSVENVQATDALGVFLFGVEPDPDPQAAPRVISLFREVTVGSAGASVEVALDAAELDLLSSTSPLTGRFSDGSLAIAFRLRRGANIGPVRLFDVDADLEGPQDLAYDTVAPVLVALGASGTGLTQLRSDMPGVSIVGRASERLRAAFVTTALGDNGPNPADPPEVVGSSLTGLFVAAPVALSATGGIVPPASLPLPFTITVYDRALNAGVLPTTASYIQLGATGPDDPLSTDQIRVEVFDATTRLPVAGAWVFTHRDDGASVARIDQTTTLTDGTQVLDATLTPGEELIVTVDATGYDLWTFHGVPTDRLGVPLVPTGIVDAEAEGIVATTDIALSSATRSLFDTRLPSPGATSFPVDACSFEPDTSSFECPFGPEAIVPRLLGAQSVLGATSPANESQYSAFTFLVAFELLAPVGPVDPGGTGVTSLDVPFLLNQVGVDFEETAIDVPARTLDTSAVGGVVVTPPRITLESLAPGIPGAVTVGLGVAFPDPAPDSWRVRAAFPGAADGVVDAPGDQLGRLVEEGSIEGDLFLRAEAVDPAGNRAAARPRLSAGSGALVPPAASTLIAPAPLGSSGGTSYDLRVADVLPDLPGGAHGIYRVTLASGGGRRWVLYRLDPPDPPSDVRIHVPDLSPQGSPLPNGTITCTISAFAWPGLDLAQLVWRDLDRQPTLLSHSIGFSFTQP